MNLAAFVSAQPKDRKEVVHCNRNLMEIPDSFTVLPQALQMFWTILHVIITGKAQTNVDDI